MDLHKMLRTLMKCSFISPTILILRQEKMHSFQRNMKLKLKLIYQRTIQQMILHSLYQYGLLLKKSTKIYTETQVINYLVQGIFQKCSYKTSLSTFSHLHTIIYLFQIGLRFHILLLHIASCYLAFHFSSWSC